MLAEKTDIAKAVRGAVGTSILGKKGASQEDQDGIDDTVAGVCAIKAFTETECDRHDEETK